MARDLVSIAQYSKPSVASSRTSSSSNVNSKGGRTPPSLMAFVPTIRLAAAADSPAGGAGSPPSRLSAIRKRFGCPECKDETPAVVVALQAVSSARRSHGSPSPDREPSIAAASALLHAISMIHGLASQFSSKPEFSRWKSVARISTEASLGILANANYCQSLRRPEVVRQSIECAGRCIVQALKLRRVLDVGSGISSSGLPFSVRSDSCNAFQCIANGVFRGSLSVTSSSTHSLVSAQGVASVAVLQMLEQSGLVPLRLMHRSVLDASVPRIVPSVRS